jgi:hypothetical protein
MLTPRVGANSIAERPAISPRTAPARVAHGIFLDTTNLLDEVLR